jgi:hypothetical protein
MGYLCQTLCEGGLLAPRRNQRRKRPAGDSAAELCYGFARLQ